MVGRRQRRSSIQEQVIAHCRKWARRVRAKITTPGLYIFGSIIHRGGRQFLPDRSDVDLIILIPDDLTGAPSRTAWLLKLQELKRELESSLSGLLRRDPAKPIVSLVAITETELSGDIHKSGSRRFFQSNNFLDLLHDTKPKPLRSNILKETDDNSRETFEFAQAIRNKFLSVSVSGKPTLTEWIDPTDPLPKEIMRHAAIATDQGYDLQYGLDNLSNYIYSQKKFHASYAALYDDWLSIRRGARGQAGPLDARDYLLLVEALLDLSFATKQRSRRVARDPSGASSPDPITRVNGFKLFYFRVNHKLTLPQLSRAADLSRSTLNRLEKVTRRKGILDPNLWFSECSQDVLVRLEKVLDAHDRLEAGKPDDFLTNYMQFYDEHSDLRPGARKGNNLKLSFQTKAVVFDFDGTLTDPGDHTTTWEKIWVALGYPKEMCFDLHTRYQQKEFTHDEWCKRTLEKFAAAGLIRERVIELAARIRLVDGVAQTVAKLRSQGLKLFILSGSIKLIIRQVLGDLIREFEEVKANELVFDELGRLVRIEGTRYDFEGKALFIKRIIQDYDLSPSDVLFVGNDCNDIFASQSGARTLCVNARLTDPANKEHWTYAIGELNDLHQIMQYVEI